MKVCAHDNSAGGNLRRIPTEFAATGQDAVSLVNSLRILWKECKLKAVDFQITAFPQPKCLLFIADAEAIKVRLLYLELSQTPPTPFLRRSQRLVLNFPRI
jgi:hypothetical protein